jgi:hypothetical protein
LKLLYLGFRFLDSALTEMLDSCIECSLNSVSLHSLAHCDQRDLIGRASCSLAGPGDALLQILDVLFDGHWFNFLLGSLQHLLQA